MTTWTVHLRSDAAPELVREGFSPAAFVFGPLWLAAHRAWVPAAFLLAAWILVGTVGQDALRGPLVLGLALLQGLSAQDLRRWALARRGYVLAELVMARGAERAWERLLARRPDLGERMARAVLR